MGAFEQHDPGVSGTVRMDVLAKYATANLPRGNTQASDVSVDGGGGGCRGSMGAEHIVVSGWCEGECKDFGRVLCVVKLGRMDHTGARICHVSTASTLGTA